MLPTAGAERKEHVLEKIDEHFVVKKKIDLSYNESNNLFLEGTGSMVLDRDNRLVFACLSPRTNRKVLDEFCNKMNYEAVVFHSVDKTGQPIYHTNVMMCIADKYVVICPDSIRDVEEKSKVIAAIQKTGKEIIDINYEQLNHFAGNMLQIENGKGEKLLVMSTQAFQSLSKEQVQKLEGYNRIIHAPLNTIEDQWRRQCKMYDGRSSFTPSFLKLFYARLTILFVIVTDCMYYKSFWSILL
jgi:hypothetical protein